MTAASPPLAESDPQAPTRALLDHPALPWFMVGIGALYVLGSGELADALRDLRLPDTDDAMRLVEVRDLVAGQSWFDMVQHRFLPPAGVPSHWSRLIDAPLGGAIAGLSALVGSSLAERVVTAFWPPLLFLAYALVLVAGMRGLFSARAGLLAIFAATQTIMLTLQFAPGHIDHHGIQIVLLLGTGLLVMRPSRSLWTGALAGGLCAVSLAIGLEALSLIAAAGLVLVFAWWREGDLALPALSGYGIALAFGALLLFGIQTAPWLWTRTACDALSPPWLWLAGTGAALAAAAYLLRPSRPGRRAVLALGLGALCLGGFFALFPACPHGPFTGMPDLVREGWLAQANEMKPLSVLLREKPAETLALAGPLFAALIAAALLAYIDAPRRWTWGVAVLFLALGVVQALFALRGLYVAIAFVPVVAGFCLDRVLASFEPTRLRAACLLAAIAFNGPFWFVGARLVEHAIGWETADKTSLTQACLKPAALRPLDALPAGLVLAPIDLGPHLLAFTRHSVVAAPYHRAISGLTAGIAVAEGSETDLRRQADLTGARYLVLCPGEPSTVFAARLSRGEAQASWLEPQPLSAATALQVWRIR